MEKLKSILNPGFGADDEVLYGTGNRQTQFAGEGSHDTSSPEAQKVHPDASADKDEGVARETLNPSDQKYEQSRDGGATASTAPSGTQTTESADKSHHTSENTEKGGLMSKLKNITSHNKHESDDHSSSTANTAGHTKDDATVGTTQSQKSVSHPVDEQTYAKDNATVGTTQSQKPVSHPLDEQTSAQHLGTDGAIGAGAGLAATSALGYDRGTPQRPTNLSTPPSTAGTLASNASIKSGVLGKAPTGSSLDQDARDAEALPNIPANGGRFMEDDSSNKQQTGDRAFPLAGGQTTTRQTDNTPGTQTDRAPASHTGRDAAFAGGASAAAIGATEAYKRHNQDQTSTPATVTSTRTSQNTAGGNHGKEGLAGAAAAAAFNHNHDGKGHNYQGDPCGPDSPAPVPHHTSGPHSTETANRLDPHHHGAQQIGSASTTTSDSHNGRNAALAGAGTAAVGAAAYESHRNQADTQTGPAPHTIGPHKSDVANVVDPRVLPDPQKQKSDHTGIETGPAPHTIGPHKSDVANVVDPRVLPDPQQQKGVHTESSAINTTSTTEKKPSILQKVKEKIIPGSQRSETSKGDSQPPHDTQSEDHHVGRDAAVAGGAAGVGVGAYEASKGHNDGASHDIISGERGALGSSSNPYSSTGLDPRVDSPEHRKSAEASRGLTGSAVHSNPEKDQHHYGRDAAIGGGVGAAGLGAYEAKKHHDQPQASPQSGSTGENASTTTTTQPTIATNTAAHPISTGTQSSATTEQRQGDDHHTGRNVALAGGAGAAGVGAYEASKHHGQHDTSSSPFKEQVLGGYEDQRAVAHHPAHHVGHEVQPDQAVHEQHAGRDAAAVGAVGATGAAAHHEFSKKDVEKWEKEKTKETEKLEKARYNEEMKHEKHAAKAHEKEEKEHKPSLISRILHHGKDKHKDDDVATSSKHHEKEAALGAGAAGTGIAAHEHNKLHKDPPKDYRSNLNSEGQHIGTDGQIGDSHSVSGLQHTSGNEHGATDASTPSQHGSGTIIDPVTGLPINIGKYGDGHGGTDASATVSGFKPDSANSGTGHVEGQTIPGHATDWEAIKKSNTPY